MSDPAEEALKLIQSRPEGILQSELWKLLEVDSRKCSRIVKKLLDGDEIERAEVRDNGVKTYLLTAKKCPARPSLLMAGEELIPCIGCERECIVGECHPLMDWMYELAIVDVKK
jgi:DNA-binding Lrp family transcriptional regulator